VQPKLRRVERIALEKRTPPPAPEIKSAPTPTKPSWMVQVGAFSTQAAANAVSQRITKAGHSATVVAGKNLHRVLVQAGPTREDALTLATQMSQSGFQGAFIVPPRQ
jgi:cell division protein FtsN